MPQPPGQRALVPYWRTPLDYDCRTDQELGRFVCPIKRAVAVDPVITVYGQVSCRVWMASRSTQRPAHAYGGSAGQCGPSGQLFVSEVWAMHECVFNNTSLPKGGGCWHHASLASFVDAPHEWVGGGYSQAFTSIVTLPACQVCTIRTAAPKPKYPLVPPAPCSVLHLPGVRAGGAA